MTTDRRVVWCCDQTGMWCGAVTTDRRVVWCCDHRQACGVVLWAVTRQACGVVLWAVTRQACGHSGVVLGLAMIKRIKFSEAYTGLAGALTASRPVT